MSSSSAGLASMPIAMLLTRAGSGLQPGRLTCEGVEELQSCRNSNTFLCINHCKHDTMSLCH